MLFCMQILDEVIKDSKRLTFSFYKYQEQERIFIEETVSKYLENLGHGNITNQVCYCIHEQASNACKANSKRVHFIEEDLDINNPEHYEIGIKNFKNSTISKLDHYFNMRKQNNLYIKFQIKKDTEYLYLSIVNNVELSNEEQIRIKSKISKAAKYSTIVDAFDDLHDPTEGAGLGICTMLIILKEIGLKNNSLNIFSRDGETHSTMTIKYS
ncbi:MAG: hypothetical protein OCD02_01535 [Spirochaetaceae bacterium]